MANDSSSEEDYPRDYPQRDKYQTPKSDDQIADLVFTNHFGILNKVSTLFEYEILINSTPPPNKKRSKAIFALAKQDPQFLNTTNRGNFATNDMSTIIAWRALSLSSQNAHNHPGVIAPQAHIVGTTWRINDVNMSNTPVPIEIRLVRILNCSEFLSHTQGDGALINLDVNPFIRAYNIMLSQSFTHNLPREHIVKIGSNKFYRDQSRRDLGGASLHTMNGYFYSVKAGNGAILLNINAACSAFYTAQTVDRFLKDTRTFMNAGQKYAALRGVQVKILFGKANETAKDASDREDREGRVHTIQSWSDEPLTHLTFNQQGQGQVRVTAYLNTKYGLQTNDPSMCAINIGTRLNKVWYAPEHLSIVPNQVYRKILPDNLTDSMVRAAARNPTYTKNFINEAVSRFLPKNNTTKILNACPALALTSVDMCQVPSEWLLYPVIEYSKDTANPQPGSRWNLRGKKFLDTKGNNFNLKYSILCRPGVQATTITNYNTAFRDMVGVYNLGRPHRVLSQNGDTVPDGQVEQKVATAKKSGASLIILILPRKEKEVYSKFKTLIDCKYGLQSLCMVEKKNTNPSWLTQYMGNIMMKANLKYGGQNHDAIFKSPTNQAVRTSALMVKTFVLGADVTHPSPGSIQYCPSIASVVGSVGCGSRKFLGSMRLQKGRREIIEEFESMVCERLHDWVTANSVRGESTFPDFVLYYRDGVDEGQYGKVKHEEVPKIRHALRKVAEQRGYAPKEAEDLMNELKITAIVVAKRHHTRFFPSENPHKRHSDKTQNTKAGLLVDRTVTSPYFTDSYLQAHSALQGTVKPTHYFFLQHEIPGSSAFMMAFTHALSYTYVRATLGVSYAPPTYYADRLCERGRCYLRGLFNGNVDYRNKFDKFAHDTELPLATKREADFGKRNLPKEKTADGKTKRRVRSAKELQREDDDKKAVKEAMETKVMEWAKDEFYKYKENKEGNPWTDEVGKVMFWM